VQADAPQRIALAAVGRVADDRMPESGEVRADLAASSGLEPDLEPRVVGAARQHAVVRRRGAAILTVRDAHAQAAVLVEPHAQRPAVVADASLHHGDVDPLDRVLHELLLQHALDGFGLGEHQQSGGLAVEPVHDEERLLALARRGALREVRRQQAIRRTVVLLRGRDRQQPGGLVDHQQAVVLVHDPELLGECRRRRCAEDDPVAGRELGGAAAHDVAVDAHPPGREPLLDAAPRCLGVGRHEVVDQVELHPPGSPIRAAFASRDPLASVRRAQSGANPNSSARVGVAQIARYIISVQAKPE